MKKNSWVYRLTFGVFTAKEREEFQLETKSCFWGIRTLPSIGEKVGELICFLCLLIHGVSVYLLRLTGRGLGQIIRFFPWTARLGILSSSLGLLLVEAGLFARPFYSQWAEFQKVHLDNIEKLGLYQPVAQMEWVALISGALLILGSLCAFIPSRLSLWILKAGCAAFLITWIWVFNLIISIPNSLWLHDDKTFDKLMRGDLWVYGVWSWLGILAIALLLLLSLVLSKVTRIYKAPSQDSTLGDRIEKSLVTGGRDPRYRSSTYWAWFIHIFILFLFPIFMRGCMLAPYKIPQGSGNPVAQMVKVKKVKKPKKEQIVFNPNSAISYYKPEIDDSKVMEEVEEETKDTYEASSMKSGKLGKGGGKEGGWPNGMENARVRFIRFKYAGGDWDQQMGKNADYNFLIKFKEMTGFKIAQQTEAIEFTDLLRYPAHRAPPFVYITGSQGINASSRAIKALRWYLTEEGGMIFADNGGGSFNSSFRSLMRKVLPDNNWIDIANDDIIYQQPYAFPNGAPPLWHHSGYRAVGMKHNGRWCVFYHQGDINDAWQTGGSGVSESLQKAAFKMGVNVVNYAFTNYLEIHFGK